MQLDAREIRYFMAVAELASFRRAAEQLSIAQPSLTRAVQALELKIGTKLLTRSTRRVELTSAGQAFLVEARLASDHLSKAVVSARAAAAGTRGSLAIGYNDFAINGVLPEILTAFRTSFPDVELRLHLLPSDEQVVGLVDGRLDAGFMLGPAIDERLEQLQISRNDFVVLLQEHHPRVTMTTIGLGDLRDERFVLGSWARWRPYREVVNRLCRRADFAPLVVEEVPESSVLFGLVAANVGVSIYTDCARNFARRGVAIRNLHDVSERSETVLAWRRPNPPPTLSRFIEETAIYVSKADLR